MGLICPQLISFTWPWRMLSLTPTDIIISPVHEKSNEITNSYQDSPTPHIAQSAHSLTWLLWISCLFYRWIIMANRLSSDRINMQSDQLHKQYRSNFPQSSTADDVKHKFNIQSYLQYSNKTRNKNLYLLIIRPEKADCWILILAHPSHPSSKPHCPKNFY